MRIFIIAGEVSGDKLGGALMAGLRTQVAELSFDGVGGLKMREQGLRSRFAMDELSLMGIVEILPKYFHLKRRIGELTEAILVNPPDVLITIDSPDFCLRVAAAVKERNSKIRTVHYVAPTVWAWRPERAERMAKFVDHVLALFPFEPPYMEKAGMDCDFVGHPVVAEKIGTEEEAISLRTVLGMKKGPLVLVLPGSRRSEVSRLTGTFGSALAKLHEKHPDMRVIVPCAAPVAGLVRKLTAHWPVRPVLVDPTRESGFSGAKLAAFRAADVALAASGTVSLELAASGTPMVIAYDMNWLSRRIIKKKLLIDTVTLVNLVSDSRTIPEFIGSECRPGPIAEALEQVLQNPGAQKEAMRLTMERLGQGGEPPGLRAAKAVLARL
jgi:lipid-A-disaccharide synthase